MACSMVRVSLDCPQVVYSLPERVSHQRVDMLAQFVPGLCHGDLDLVVGLTIVHGFLLP